MPDLPALLSAITEKKVSEIFRPSEPEIHFPTAARDGSDGMAGAEPYTKSCS